MKLRQKILIDRTLGHLIATLLNVTARVLGKLLRIDHSLERSPSTIAVCKLMGLGSIIQSGPLIRSLRTKFPEARILYITHASNSGYVSAHFPVDQVIGIKDHSIIPLINSVFGCLFILWKRRPEIYIDLEIYSNFSSVLTTLSLSTNRLGFYKSDKHYRVGMYTHMMFFNVQAPVNQAYLQFSRLLGSDDNSTELIAPVVSADSESMFTDRMRDLSRTPVRHAYFVINPNASELRLERRWPAASFVRLTRKLLSMYPEHLIYFTGNKSEAPYVTSMLEDLQEERRIINSAGKLGLDELVILLKNADLLISNDTGPVHIASSLKVRSVALFGPCSPDHYGSSEYCFPVYKKTYCSPCVHEFILPPCKGKNICMQLISVEDVTEAVIHALTNKEKRPSENSYIFSNDPDLLGVIHCR